MASKYTEFGEIREGSEDKGGGLYVKIVKDIVLKEGTTVYIDTPSEKITKLVELGFIKEDEAEERLAKIPEWKKYLLTVRNT